MSDLNEYNKSYNKVVKTINAIEKDDFSNIDYENIRKCKLFELTNLVNIKNYLLEKGYTGKEFDLMYQRYDYLIGLVLSYCEEPYMIQKKSKQIINKGKFIWVNLYDRGFLDEVDLILKENELKNENSLENEKGIRRILRINNLK
ncbi:hypothetical protein [Pseudomonas aeruginosa]|uniref:hypothetical protein n=1 Tax=Pseudomonas aeruginosa TaxID=287 RepID=UPI001048A0D3|nr:hypothetical protein [Pseudomonas aeruginosa]